MIQIELKPNLFKHLVPFQIIYFLRRDDTHLSDVGDYNMVVYILEMIDSFFV